MTHLNYSHYKKEIGIRFATFRQMVAKSRSEFAEEADLPTEYISQIEMGTILPGIISMEYFYREYGVNLTWLVTGNGNIFQSRGPRTPKDAYSQNKSAMSDKKEPINAEQHVIQTNQKYHPFHQQTTSIIRMPDREVNNG